MVRTYYRQQGATAKQAITSLSGPFHQKSLSRLSRPASRRETTVLSSNWQLALQEQNDNIGKYGVDSKLAEALGLVQSSNSPFKMTVTNTVTGQKYLVRGSDSAPQQSTPLPDVETPESKLQKPVIPESYVPAVYGPPGIIPQQHGSVGISQGFNGPPMHAIPISANQMNQFQQQPMVVYPFSYQPQQLLQLQYPTTVVSHFPAVPVNGTSQQQQQQSVMAPLTLQIVANQLQDNVEPGAFVNGPQTNLSNGFNWQQPVVHGGQQVSAAYNQINQSQAQHLLKQALPQTAISVPSSTPFRSDEENLPPWLRGNPQPRSGVRGSTDWSYAQQTASKTGFGQTGFKTGLKREYSLPNAVAYTGDVKQDQAIHAAFLSAVVKNAVRVEAALQTPRHGNESQGFLDGFGRGGCGAPMKDRNGQLITDRRLLKLSWNGVRLDDPIRTADLSPLGTGPNSMFGDPSFVAEQKLGNQAQVEDQMVSGGPLTVNSNRPVIISSESTMLQAAVKLQQAMSDKERYELELKQQVEEKRMLKEMEKERQRLEDEKDEARLKAELEKLKAEADAEQRRQDAKRHNEEQRQAVLQQSLQLKTGKTGSVSHGASRDALRDEPANSNIRKTWSHRDLTVLKEEESTAEWWEKRGVPTGRISSIDDRRPINLLSNNNHPTQSAARSTGKTGLSRSQSMSGKLDSREPEEPLSVTVARTKPVALAASQKCTDGKLKPAKLKKTGQVHGDRHRGGVQEETDSNSVALGDRKRALLKQFEVIRGRLKQEEKRVLEAIRQLEIVEDDAALNSSRSLSLPKHAELSSSRMSLTSGSSSYSKPPSRVNSDCRIGLNRLLNDVSRKNRFIVSKNRFEKPILTNNQANAVQSRNGNVRKPFQHAAMSVE